MNLEIGDFFAIKRGHMVSPEVPVPIGPDEMHMVPAQYDRGWVGAVFEVLHQDGDFVAAKCVFPSPPAGQTVHLDISELDVMTLPALYVTALKTGTQFTNPPPPPADVAGLFNAFLKKSPGNY